MIAKVGGFPFYKMCIRDSFTQRFCRRKVNAEQARLRVFRDADLLQGAGKALVLRAGADALRRVKHVLRRRAVLVLSLIHI